MELASVCARLRGGSHDVLVYEDDDPPALIAALHSLRRPALLCVHCTVMRPIRATRRRGFAGGWPGWPAARRGRGRAPRPAWCQPNVQDDNAARCEPKLACARRRTAPRTAIISTRLPAYREPGPPFWTRLTCPALVTVTRTDASQQCSSAGVASTTNDRPSRLRVTPTGTVATLNARTSSGSSEISMSGDSESGLRTVTFGSLEREDKERVRARTEDGDGRGQGEGRAHGCGALHSPRIVRSLAHRRSARAARLASRRASTRLPPKSSTCPPIHPERAQLSQCQPRRLQLPAWNVQGRRGTGSSTARRGRCSARRGQRPTAARALFAGPCRARR